MSTHSTCPRCQQWHDATARCDDVNALMRYRAADPGQQDAVNQAESAALADYLTEYRLRRPAH